MRYHSKTSQPQRKLALLNHVEITQSPQPSNLPVVKFTTKAKEAEKEEEEEEEDEDEEEDPAIQQCKTPDGASKRSDVYLLSSNKIIYLSI